MKWGKINDNISKNVEEDSILRRKRTKDKSDRLKEGEKEKEGKCAKGKKKECVMNTERWIWKTANQNE